jgi:rRNA maturation protein Nop10
MSAEYKVCPQCREEFTLMATECADCGGRALVFPGDLEPEADVEAFPGVESLRCVRVGPLPWTRALSEGLSQASIGHRVERDTRSEDEGGVGPGRFDGHEVFGTWVRPEDLEDASAIDRALFGHLEPDAAEPAGADDACPACGDRLPAAAVECPGCGLHFG